MKDLSVYRNIASAGNVDVGCFAAVAESNGYLGRNSSAPIKGDGSQRGGEDDVILQWEGFRGWRSGAAKVHRYRVVAGIEHLHARRGVSPDRVSAGPLNVPRELPCGIRKPQ
jgi:hypothetical protein